MILLRLFLTVILTLGVLFLGSAKAADRVERSIDEQGTIHIGVKPPAKQEKAGEVRVPYDPLTGTGPPPWTVPPQSRRSRGASDARQKAFEQAHPDMVETLREAEKRRAAVPEAPMPEAPAPEAPPAQPEQPPAPKAPGEQE